MNKQKEIEMPEIITDPQKLEVALRIAEILEHTSSEAEGVSAVADYVLDREQAIRAEYEVN
jgi:hypothetical protein